MALPLKIATYNVNGIRAAQRKGFSDWLNEKDFDVVCLQEIKANADQIETEIKAYTDLGYHCHWYSAQKKGYSGTAILSKQAPDNIVNGIGHELFDGEGRVVRADFGDWSVLSCYFPSGSSGDARQEVKMAFLNYFHDYISELRKERPQLIVCGDYNICHKAIDIHDPIRNKNSSGFLPEERAWMDKWFESGFTDTFRHFEKEPEKYTWWSYRAGARQRNKGWRIDYISTTENLKEQLVGAGHYPNDFHSDHCASYVHIAL